MSLTPWARVPAAVGSQGPRCGVHGFSAPRAGVGSGGADDAGAPSRVSGLGTYTQDPIDSPEPLEGPTCPARNDPKVAPEVADVVRPLVSKRRLQ